VGQSKAEHRYFIRNHLRIVILVRMPEANDRDPVSETPAQGTAYLVLKNLIGGFANFALLLFVAKFLEQASDLGAFQGLQMLIFLFTLVAGFGLTMGAVRFSSLYFGSDQHKIAIRFCAMVIRLGLMFSITVAVLVYLNANLLAETFFHSSVYAISIRISAIIIFLYSMLLYCNAVFYSLQKFKKVAMLVIVDWVLKVLLALGITALAIPSINGILVGFVLGDFCVLVISFLLLRPFVFSRSGFGFSHFASLMRYSLPLVPSTILAYLSMNADYYMILIMSGVYSAGLYTPSIIMGMGLQVIAIGLAETLLPHFSRTFGKGGLSALSAISYSSTRYLFLYFLPLGLISLSISPLIITLLLGNVYPQSLYSSIIIITTVTLTSVGIYVFNYVLLAAGYTRIFLYSTLLSFPVQILLSYALIPPYEITGAAVAKAVGLIIMFVVPLTLLRRLNGLNYDELSLKNGIIGSIVVCIPLFILNYLVASIYLIPISIIGGSVGYLLYLRLVRGIKSEDIMIVENAFPITRRFMRIVSKLAIR
jgi:O-antigen/teichoic acid export membrane protein